MKKNLTICFLVLACLTFQLFAQIPTNVMVQISKAEDELRFDKALEDLMKSKNAKIRQRAALASGRIGRETAIPMLTRLLESDSDVSVRAASTFALGEIESIKASDAILKVLKDTKNADAVRARAVEAAGKIVAANSKDEKAKNLSEAILDILQFEENRVAKQNREVILLGITAILRAKPENGDSIAGSFLTNGDAGIRADAANTLSRLRSKIANEKLRAMLLSDSDANARANAARALGAAEDKDAFNLLLEAAVSDEDSRVRVSAIRSLGSLKDAKAADRLLTRGENLLTDYKKSKSANPKEKNELLEIATTLGRILLNTNNEKAISFLSNFYKLDKYHSSEVSIAIMRVSPASFIDSVKSVRNSVTFSDWQVFSSVVQGFGEAANLDGSGANEKIKKEALTYLLNTFINGFESVEAGSFITKNAGNAIPDLLRANVAFKPDYAAEGLRNYLKHKDIIVRATAAELLGEQTVNKENVEALKNAFAESLKTDKQYNDAQLATLSALVKLDKKEAFDSLKLALAAADILIRRQAAQLIKQNDLQADFPNADEKVGTIKPYNPKTKTKLGVILNTNADYVRAVSRKNARAILTTEKGTFTIEFFPEAAPLTVDNFIKLARSNYFNGLAIHRVVPNFVMQDGDPRGDGNGGPGWEIRDEINEIPFERGAVGMALSGRDTGGSQWFVCHSPQPHLDGGYTVFGRVNEIDMKIVDNLVRGDRILTVKIIENNEVALTTKDKQKAKTKR